MKSFKKVIREQNSAAIYVTHDLAVVAQVADYIVVLYSGEVMEHGSVDQIINHPTHAYTKRLMAAVRPKPTAGMGTAVGTEHDRAIDNIEVKNMATGYGGIEDGEPRITVLRDINVSVKNSHVVGVIGESGCGKSTLAKVMAGMLPPARGDIILDGKVLEGALGDRDLEDTIQKREMAVGIAKGVDITAKGCPFYNRCPMGIEGTCETTVPPELVLEDGHIIACHMTLEALQDAETHTQQILHGFEKVGEDEQTVHTAH
ncbi:MAG: ATP-binding cassette domain-containing protein [Gammaproteobacteria bacterium]